MNQGSLRAIDYAIKMFWSINEHYTYPGSVVKTPNTRIAERSVKVPKKRPGALVWTCPRSFHNNHGIGSEARYLHIYSTRFHLRRWLSRTGTKEMEMKIKNGNISFDQGRLNVNRDLQSTCRYSCSISGSLFSDTDSLSKSDLNLSADASKTCFIWR